VNPPSLLPHFGEQTPSTATVLEWRLDPTCSHHIAEADSANLRMIIVCDEGYSSSLAAAWLRQLGIERATDLIGGFQAWERFCAQAQMRAGEGLTR
jgi:rhodanese-related sulfurtransferase